MFNSALVCCSLGVAIFLFGLKTSLKQSKNRNCYFSLTTLFCLLANLSTLTRNLLLVSNKAFYFGKPSALTFKNLYSILCSFFCFFLEWHFAKRFVRLLHKLHENAKWKPFSTAPGVVYRSIDSTCVANQIARLGDSRSLRYANIELFVSTANRHLIIKSRLGGMIFISLWVIANMAVDPVMVARMARLLALIHIAVGVLLICFGIADRVVEFYYNWTGYGYFGIWIGVWVSN